MVTSCSGTEQRTAFAITSIWWFVYVCVGGFGGWGVPPQLAVETTDEGLTGKVSKSGPQVQVSPCQSWPNWAAPVAGGKKGLQLSAFAQVSGQAEAEHFDSRPESDQYARAQGPRKLRKPSNILSVAPATPVAPAPKPSDFGAQEPVDEGPSEGAEGLGTGHGAPFFKAGVVFCVAAHFWGKGTPEVRNLGRFPS